MKKLTMMIVALMAIFAVQSVAEAASISKRVRVLEVKVSKQNKLIRQQTRAQARSELAQENREKQQEEAKEAYGAYEKTTISSELDLTA